MWRRRGVLESSISTLKIVVTFCATEGLEKTLDLSLLFEVFSLFIRL